MSDAMTYLQRWCGHGFDWPPPSDEVAGFHDTAIPAVFKGWSNNNQYLYFRCTGCNRVYSRYCEDPSTPVIYCQPCGRMIVLVVHKRDAWVGLWAVYLPHRPRPHRTQSRAKKRARLIDDGLWIEQKIGPRAYNQGNSNSHLIFK